MTLFLSLRIGNWPSIIFLGILFVVGSVDCNIVKRNDGTDVNVQDAANPEQSIMQEKVNDRLNRWKAHFQEKLLRKKVENRVIVQALREENQELFLKIRQESKRISQLKLKQQDQVKTIEQLKEKFSNFERKFTELKNSKKMVEPAKLLNDIAKKPNTQSSIPESTFRGMPTSCEELSLIGYTLNGIYSVKSNDNTKISSVYCDFSQPGVESLIGYTDIKSISSGVYFHVQRSSSTSGAGFSGVVTYEKEELNVGGGMNISSGIFTPPVDGIYHFSFSTVKAHLPTYYLEIDLQMYNGGSWTNIGRAYAQENGSSNYYVTITVEATLKLRAGYNSVRMEIWGGTLFDDGRHMTQFNGQLLQEDLKLA